MHTSRPFQPVHDLAMLARLMAVIAFCFLLCSAVSTADDDVQQCALTGSRLHALRIFKVNPSDLGSAAALVSIADTCIQRNRARFHKVASERILVLLEPSLRRTGDRSPPLFLHV